MKSSFACGTFDAAANEACELIGGLAHPERLRIVCALAAGEASVADLAKRIGGSTQAIRRRLAHLRKERIVRARRRGQEVVFALGDARIAKLIPALAEVFHAAKPEC